MEKQRFPLIIIAMKGHPGTGKTMLARAISSSLKLPLLDKDDIKDHTLHLHAQHNVLSSSLNELSYSVLFQIARTQLSLGLSVVLDSPLSRLAHLDSLVQMAKEYGARVVVVECNPKDKEEWRRRLEERGKSINDGSRHKPSTWQEMEKLLEGYNGCWDYNVGDFANKIVVDTTAKEHNTSDLVDLSCFEPGKSWDLLLLSCMDKHLLPSCMDIAAMFLAATSEFNIWAWTVSQSLSWPLIC